jgi:hypothetical protein
MKECSLLAYFVYGYTVIFSINLASSDGRIYGQSQAGQEHEDEDIDPELQLLMRDVNPVNRHLTLSMVILFYRVTSIAV